MSKYRRVCSNVEIHEKKKSKKNQEDYNNPAYVNTTTLMEKLGIKINNSDAFSKQAASNINIRKNKAPIMYSNSIPEFNEDEDDAINKKETACRSQQKRNKNSIKNEIRTENIINVIKKKEAFSSVDKRIVKKKKKNNENRNNISLVKKEKNKDDEIIRKKTVKSKTTIEKKDSEITENNKPNKKNKENAENKGNKGNDEIKKTKTNKKQKNASAEKINSSSHNQNLNNDESKQNMDIRKSKKLKDSELNKKKEKEKENDKKNENNGEMERKKKKNKAQSMEKEIGTEQALKFREKLLFGKKKKSLITGDNSDAEVEESSDSGSSSFDLDKHNKSKNQSKTQVPDMKAIVRSTKKHGTEMASQEDLTSLQRSSNKKRTSVEKEKEKELDGEKETQPKIVSFRPSEDKKNSLIFGSKYLKRRSMDNAKVRDRLEQLMNEQTLKQNGGNTLFLRNYEKGPVYQKEIEIIVKNQTIKKNIKIGSCTKAGCSGPGIVKTNQDAYFIKEDFLKNSNNIIAGVCDGHGHKGELISNYAVNKLPQYITDINNDSIINEFKKINQEIYSNSNMESDMAGTTVVSVILTPEKMMCVNLGDSRAAIFKYENGLYYCKNLSRDHKPNEPDENKRIINNNGRIKKCFDEDIKKFVGPDRVWLKNKEEPGLAMSRSLGDKIAHTIGVSDEPEIKCYDYDGTEKFIIIASDGIWEYVHGDECIKVIKSFYEDNKDVEEAAFAMVKEAFRKWKRKEVAIDDITVIIIFFDD